MADMIVGTAFDLLKAAVAEAVRRVTMFKGTLQRLKKTVEALEPTVRQIDQLNNQLDELDDSINRRREIMELKELMNTGLVLVRKCLQVSWWELYDKYQYQEKLTVLETSLREFVSLNTVLQIARDQKQMLAIVMQSQTAVAVGLPIVRSPEAGIIRNQSLFFGCRPSKPPKTVGLDVPLEDLKKLLFDDATSVLVLSAPPGYGKTTLAMKLCWDEEVIGKYQENIFFVTFSQKPTLKDIVRKLLLNDDAAMQNCSTDNEAMEQLESSLQQFGKSPILLVIDDVWPESERLVEKFMFQLPNYKIIVTSRFELRRFGTPFSLGQLNDEDGLTLFRNLVSLDESVSSDLLEELEPKIVKACGGSPLAIEIVAGSLYRQPAVTWRNMVLELCRGNTILDSQDSLLDYLQKSFDVICRKPIQKECFMDLGLFPKGQRIPAFALMDMWAELHKLDEDGVMAMGNIQDLSNRNLAKIAVNRKLQREEDNYYNGYYVTQLDILRELAVHQSSQGMEQERKRLAIDINGEYMPEWLSEEEELAAKTLSISTDKKTLDWCNMKPSHTVVLILNLSAEEFTLPKFLEKMISLKVLLLTNYGHSPLELKNMEVLGSLPNLRKIRLEQVSLPSLVQTPLQLENLRKISLFMCSASNAFGPASEISIVMPNLVEINLDYCNDIIELPANLFGSLKLKRLSITNCHKLCQMPEDIGKLKGLEVLKLASCTDLEELPESVADLDKLSLLDISDCISLENLPEEMGKLCSLRKLYMSGCSRLKDLPSSVMDLKKLRDVECDEETAALWEPFIFTLTDLKIRERKLKVYLDLIA